MSKPNDIPQDVREAVLSAYFARCDATTKLFESITEAELVDVAARAVMAERERAAKVCEDQAQQFLSPQYASNQPLGSFCERFACEECATAIRKGTP